MVRDCDAAPSYGLTLGMSDLLQAHEILLVATGPAKRQPLAQSLDGTITTRFPASLLQLHAQCTILADAAASPVAR
jgi:glucosamine-6-phosphate deaminase